MLDLSDVTHMDLEAMQAVFARHFADESEKQCHLPADLQAGVSDALRKQDVGKAQSWFAQVRQELVMSLVADKFNHFFESIFCRVSNVVPLVANEDLISTFETFVTSDEGWNLVYKNDGLRAWHHGKLSRRLFTQKEELCFSQPPEEIEEVVFNDWLHQPRYFGKVMTRAERVADFPAQGFLIMKGYYLHGLLRDQLHVCTSGFLRFSLADGSKAVLRKSVPWKYEENEAEDAKAIQTEVLAGGYIIKAAPEGEEGSVVTRLLQLRMGKDHNFAQRKLFTNRTVDLLLNLKTYLDSGDHKKV